MLEVIYTFFVICSIFLMFWYQGHFGRWGIVRSKYPIGQIPIIESVTGSVYFQNKTSGFNVVKVGGDANGLYLSVERYFQVFYPSIMVPWSDIVGYRRQKKLFHSQVNIKIKGLDFEIELPEKAYETIKKHFKQIVEHPR